MNMAAYNPHLVKVPAKFSSLIYRGVFEVVSSFSSKTPLLLFFPTLVTTAFPVPDTIKDYESKNGSGDSLKLLSFTVLFLIALISFLL